MKALLQAIPRRTLVIAVVAALVLASVGLVLRHRSQRTLVADFTETKGIYVGDDVTVLGVPIGEITSIDPGPHDVRVTMRIRSNVELPANVKAEIQAESLVSVRTVALDPVYSGGPTFSGEAIPLSRTTVPVEWDDIKSELVTLTKALGPQGANKNGALSNLVTSSAGFLHENAPALNTTINDMSTAMTTLAESSGDLFSTVRNLEVFISALRSSDSTVRSFYQQLDTASTLLARNRSDLAGALSQMNTTFGKTGEFLRRNQQVTATSLTDIRKMTSLLSEHRQDIADILQLAPTAVSNFRTLLDPRVPAITGELAVSNLTAPAQLICGALMSLGGGMNTCVAALQPLVQGLALGAPPVGVNVLGSNSAGQGGVESPASQPKATQPQTAVPAPGTPSTGGLLGGLLGLLGGS